MIEINHSEYMKKVKLLPVESLRYIIKDCNEAIKANPSSEKTGYYADEINYCAMGLQRRSKKEKS